MVTCWRNLLCSSTVFNELDKLSTLNKATTHKRQITVQKSEATIQNNKTFNRLSFTIPGFSDLDSTLAPKPTSISKPALAIIYLEVDLQQLLKICISAKQVPYKP